MAVITPTGREHPPVQAQSIQTGANLAGAVVSVGLIIGIGVWGYKILARDVSGVPVVRAAEGAMRQAPEDPGGTAASHQGLAVNDVAAQGSATSPADSLTLAPRPVTLTEEDTPIVAVAAQPRTEPVKLNSETEVLAEEAPDAPLSPQMASIQALAEQLSEGTKPLTEMDLSDTPPVIATVKPLAEAPAAPTEVAAVAPIALAPQSATIKTVLRPRQRPAKLITASAPAVSDAVNAALDIAAADVPAGTRLVQLGAFDSPEVAKKEWTRLAGRFGDYMDGKNRVIQKAKSGGRTFYRLRAMGFADISDARRFCSALVAERADCIPVTTK